MTDTTDPITMKARELETRFWATQVPSSYANAKSKRESGSVSLAIAFALRAVQPAPDSLNLGMSSDEAKERLGLAKNAIMALTQAHIPIEQLRRPDPEEEAFEAFAKKMGAGFNISFSSLRAAWDARGEFEKEKGR